MAVGISGSVRIQRLSGVALSAAEAHGKRLDRTGKFRSIIGAGAAPVSSTGLDLNSLYETHVEGAKIHKSNTKALHMLLQFPTDLVGGEKADAMLRHARKFAESIFGDAAIFADRVDRDEKSLHVVDLFLAPKHKKDYKLDKNGKIPPSQEKVSTSKDLKALAVKYGKAPTLRGQGQALQDAWFEYLKGLGLGVERGQAKKRPGDDWLSPEELEFNRKAAALRAIEEDLEKQKLEQEQIIKDNKIAQLKIAEEKTRLSALDTSLKGREDTVRAREASVKPIYEKIEETSRRLNKKEIELTDREKTLASREASFLPRKRQIDEDFKSVETRSNNLAFEENELLLKVEEHKDALFVYNSLRELKFGNNPITKIMANINHHIQTSGLSVEFKNAVNIFSDKLMNITKVVDISKGYEFKKQPRRPDKDIDLDI